MDDSVLHLRDLRVTLGAELTLRFPDLDLQRGESLVVTGPSGCGKSTFLNLIAGLIRPGGGTLLVQQQDLSRLRPADLDHFRGRHIGMVHQNFHLLDAFTALENVRAGLRFGPRLPAARARETAQHMLERVGLRDRLHSPVQRLSRGERQRVAIARALAASPSLLLSDEATGSLDPARARDVMDLMEQLCREIQCAWICVTHDETLAARFPRRLDATRWIHTEARP